MSAPLAQDVGVAPMSRGLAAGQWNMATAHTYTRWWTLGPRSVEGEAKAGSIPPMRVELWPASLT
jgi:hypothetical protein